MKYEKVYIKDKYPLDTDAYFEVMIPENVDDETYNKKRTVIVLPGGGYAFCSKREGDPIALNFMAKGYNACVLNYSVSSTSKDYKYPKQILEVMCTMDYLRNKLNDKAIINDAICVIGFSAGGHLCATYGYLSEDESLKKMVGLEGVDLKPNALGLSYPVITSGHDSHLGSIENVTMGDKNEELLEKLSADKNVTKDYPKTFIWTTANDGTVPPINTYKMDRALTEASVEHYLTVYPQGTHGLSLANELTMQGIPEMNNKEVQPWIENIIDFFNRVMPIK